MKYFAYGSNLSWDRIVNRCKSAVFIETATLSGWSLDFRGPLYDAKATIIPSADGTVFGAIVDLTAKDFLRLDGFEGVSIGRYSRHEIRAVGFTGTGHKCTTYVMCPDIPGTPSIDYFEVIETGYRECGLPIGPLHTSLGSRKPATRRQRAPKRSNKENVGGVAYYEGLLDHGGPCDVVDFFSRNRVA